VTAALALRFGPAIYDTRRQRWRSQPACTRKSFKSGGHATISQTLDTYAHTTQTLHEEAAAKLVAIMDGGS